VRGDSGNRLIVATNHGALVRGLQETGRLVVVERERARLMASLAIDG
jgi:bifunctional ADP-heptose synthase (sugar kinase/adenylyltransferase)